MEKRISRKNQTSALRRYGILVMLIIFGYLCQVCVMPYIRIFGVTPNLLYVIIGIVTVAYGKLRAFWVGLCYGILMEIMLPSVPYLHLILYPVTTLFCSFAFADKPLKTIEYERAVNKKSKELPPWLRTVLCTALNILVFEVVNVTYIYLGGSPLTFSHFSKAFLIVLLTTLLCLVLLFPIRRLILGPKSETLVLRSAPVVFTRN
jgi:hypothetical protein